MNRRSAEAKTARALAVEKKAIDTSKPLPGIASTYRRWIALYQKYQKLASCKAGLFVFFSFPLLLWCDWCLRLGVCLSLLAK